MQTWVPTEPNREGIRAAAHSPLSPAALLLLLFVPVDWFVLITLFCAELFGRFWRRIALRTPPKFLLPRPECSFVILSWNSQSMLAESLPPLLDVVRKSGGKHEIIVVDNHSADGTDEYIKRHFPEIRLISSEENIYFGAGNRLGIKAATRDILVLMNSDTIVRPDFLPPLLAALADPATFGVASQVLGQGRSETGNTHARFNGTQVEWSHDPVTGLKKGAHHPVFWLHRGLFAVDRRKYVWLGGLDGLYDPLYMEDIDLSYRAWKVGWNCLLAVDSQVSHHHHFSTRLEGEIFLRTIVRRNQYIFLWKNVNDLAMMAKYIWWSGWTRFRRVGAAHTTIGQEIRSLMGALERLHRVVVGRVVMSCLTMRTDPEVFELTAGTQQSLGGNKVTAPPIPMAAGPRTGNQ